MTGIHPFMTYYMSSANGKLKFATRQCCNFWNRFVEPSRFICLQVGVFESEGMTIARAWLPVGLGIVTYSKIEFNAKYLSSMSQLALSHVLTHEAGHSLGIGFDKWMELFHHNSGKFYPHIVQKVPTLGPMTVETDHGPGTVLSHWDEEDPISRLELMSGFKNNEPEFCLPVTIDVMELLGHRVIERLPDKTPMEDLLMTSAEIAFSRQDQAISINRKAEITSAVMEEIYR